jgi:hypothetical protein
MLDCEQVSIMVAFRGCRAISAAPDFDKPAFVCVTVVDLWYWHAALASRKPAVRFKPSLPRYAGQRCEHCLGRNFEERSERLQLLLMPLFAQRRVA